MSVFFAKRKTFLAYEHPINRSKYTPNTVWRVGLTKLCILQSLVENPNNLILRSNLWPVWPKLDELLKKTHKYLNVRFREQIRVFATSLADIPIDWNVDLVMIIEYEDRIWNFDCNLNTRGRGVALTKFTPKENLEFRKAICSGKGKITIEIRFGGRRLNPPTTIEMPFQPIPTTCFARKLLEEQIQTDVRLVALNGDVFPCHKGFLAAQSAWFHHLFQSRPEEKIWKFRMTEEGLTAFLKYIYYADSEDPKKNLKIAMELLKIGRMYKIISMEKGMTDLLLEVPTTAFTREIALELSCFTRKEKGFEALKNKAIELEMELCKNHRNQKLVGGEDLDTEKDLEWPL
ncbi:unnamed protein product [Orchesella dallaii]|uniref:BTB domain-containing protein n=1 Tax=Orchesella dallaii TaxID=48710 RepID=A0ABP1RYB5_9HEXA